MLQQRQIVKASDTQIGIEDLAYRKYAITDFRSIIWMFIAVIVTIYRNAAASSQSCPISHWMLMTTKLRSSI
jgi:hypothetical protein